MSASSSAPQKQLLNEQAYDLLKKQILGESLAPGSFLSERKLAQSMDLSLTPIRRALQRLADEGFVRIAPRQGAVVVEMTVHEVLDVYEIRKVLESFVARKISGSLNKEQEQALLANIEAQRAAKQREDLEETVQLDMEFHAMLCRFSGNMEVQRVMQQLRDKVYRIIVRSARLQSDRTWASIEEHEAIADAIIQGNAKKAVAGMEKHMDFGRQLVLLR